MTIRAGVAGVGRLGAVHARLLSESPGFDLVGIHDVDGDRATAVAHEYSTRSLALDSLLRACDALVVAVPTPAHADVACAALEAGCHVLVEKPLAPTLPEADRIVSLADRKDLVLGVGHVERFNGIMMACRPYLDAPRFIESRRLAAFQPRGTDVTVVLDLMIHDIDLVLGLVDQPIADVQAIGASIVTGSIDMANARLTFADGAVADISASRVSLKPFRQLRLYQKSGYFSLDLAGGSGEHLRATEAPPAEIRGIQDIVERIPLTPVQGEPLGRELEAFGAAIRGEPSRLVTGEKGREALDVAIRITREIEESTDVTAQDS